LKKLTSHFHDQKFIKYGRKINQCYDVVLHIRNREFCKYRNWDLHKWLKLIKKLKKENLKIACVGTTEESLNVEMKVDNLMNIPLKKLADILHSSKLFVGQSSGVGHFASFCGCPHVIWGESNSIKDMYRRTTNPFKTQVKFFVKTNPSVEEIFESIICAIRYF